MTKYVMASKIIICIIVFFTLKGEDIMKKHIVALITVLALLVAVIPMQAMAAGTYPYIKVDETASTPTITKGDSGKISVTIEASLKAKERCVVTFRDSDKDRVGGYTLELANTPLKEREIVVPIDAAGMNLPVGAYTATIWVEAENQSLGRWEALDPFASFPFDVIANKCDGGHTLEKESVVKLPTCEFTGLDKYVCSVCDHVVYKETAKKEHTFKVKKWLVEPSHAAGRAGEALLYCVTCTEPNEKIEVIPLSQIAKITTQPKDAEVSVGYRASFTVKATGKDLTYQWYYRNAGETTWRTSSCKEASYHVTSALALDGRQFKCKVKDAYDKTAETNVVTLTLPVAKITKQPKDVTVGYGEKAVVTIAATGDVLKYTWEYSNDGGTNWNPSSYTGTAYSQTMTVPVDGRMLRCTVTDKYGNTAHSNEVTLKIDRTELKITAQPKSVSAPSGEKAVISVTAVGDGLRYQWQYSTDNGVTWKDSSCKARTYTQTLSAAVDGRLLRCVVDDVYDDGVYKTTSEAKLSVQRTELKITQHPQSVTAAYGTKATFTVAATGDGVKYQWWYKNADDTDWNKSSCTSRTYSQTLNEKVDGRKLRCVVTDAYGDTEVPSKEATITVQRKELAITAHPKSVANYEGVKVSVSVSATGDGLKYQWQYSDDDGASWKTSSCTSRTYSQTLNASVDGRMLRCKVTDAYGNGPKTSNAATLDTRFKAKITTQPASVKVFDGDKAKVSIAATGDGIKYQWYYSTDGGNSFSKSSCTATSYSQTMSKSIDGRKLYCVVTDKYGNTAKSNTITLGMKKTVQITSQPKSQTKDEGEKATFTVKATGDGLKYQWYYSTNGGSSFSKSSCVKATYSQTAKASVDGRQFYCVVTDAYGNHENTKTVTLNVE